MLSVKRLSWRAFGALCDVTKGRHPRKLFHSSLSPVSGRPPLLVVLKVSGTAGLLCGVAVFV